MTQLFQKRPFRVVAASQANADAVTFTALDYDRSLESDMKTRYEIQTMAPSPIIDFAETR